MHYKCITSLHEHYICMFPLHLHTEPKLRTSGDTQLFPLYAVMPWKGKTVHLVLPAN